jgi:hypothetical protein
MRTPGIISIRMRPQIKQGAVRFYAWRRRYRWHRFLQSVAVLLGVVAIGGSVLLGLFGA